MTKTENKGHYSNNNIMSIMVCNGKLGVIMRIRGV